ncbi:MAG: GNAT family N-acetyltransferase [Spirulina sp. SIO3F2]|nr:GNAT family N-acetyltransferase [Spirulina sp. SIO3F2]
MDCRHIQFKSGHSMVDFAQVQTLLQKTAFWAQDRNLADLETAIAYSDPVITVWNHTQLIGFARATSDRVYRATIWDVLIHPDYQKCGLGRKLVETVLAHPHVNHVERVYLMTTYKQAFYKRIGFTENSTTTMVLHQNQPSHETLIQDLNPGVEQYVLL